MTLSAIHIRSNSTGKTRREQREGRETIVMPSYAAKADTVLNDVLYPRDELEKSYHGLNRTPAPLGHPLLNGDYVSASDPEAIARHHVFAWNENPRWDGDRIALDVVIDEVRANECEGGRKVLEAIKNETPISTSTGLLCNLEEASDKSYQATARNIEWDHVAILLDEAPAISPEQGVGIFVNTAKGGEKLEIINSTIEEDFNQEIEWAAEQIFRAIERKDERKEDRPLVERIKSAILKAVGIEAEETANEGDAEMTDKAQFDALSAKVDDLAGNAITKDDLTNALTEALKPITDAQAEITANAKAKADADHAALVNKVVEAKIDGLTEDVATKMDDVALNALLTMHEKQNKKAAPLAGGFGVNSDKSESMSPLAWGAAQ